MIAKLHDPMPAEPAIHDSYDPAHFAPLFASEDRHFWFRTRNLVISLLAKQLVAGFGSDARILEVGCGTGNVLRVLEQICPPGTVAGMDLFMEGLRFAGKRTVCPLVQGDVHTPPFRRQFDLIGLFDVLEHLPDDLQVLRDLHAMLASGGALFLTVPAHRSLWSYFDTASDHYRRYEQHELQDRLIEAGFRIEYLTQYMVSIFPFVRVGRAAATLRARLRSGKQDRSQEMLYDELRVRPGVNEILLWLLAQENRFIRKRYRLPAGTSLLAIARKGT